LREKRDETPVTVRHDKKYKKTGECEIEMPSPFCLVIFGATGDLSRKKIFPSLYRLNRDGYFPEDFVILGTARSEMDDIGFRELIRDSLKSFLPTDFAPDSWTDFAEHVYYTRVDYDQAVAFTSLGEKIFSLEKKYRTRKNRIFYLAVPPSAYESVAANIASLGFAREDEGYSHIVIEKPIGRDLDSARNLNVTVNRYFGESQIYRMDHYLAKETVQNILMFRFANSIFEPLWNRRYIDHVQITVSESIGIGHRAGYYDEAGVLRDMFQNHIFQLLSLTAMEPPTAFEAERVRDEKVKVFRSVRQFPQKGINDLVVLGQYGAGKINGEDAVGYRDEPGVRPASTTPTFAAMKVFVDNWRWNGVPFYLRSGKRLSKRKAEISVHFRQVPHLMFSPFIHERIEPNTLVIRVQPDEGISLLIQAKTQGSKVCLNPVTMDFSYPKVISLSDYERVLLDCMQGDQMLFVREDWVEQTWSLLMPVLERVEKATVADEFPNYAAGSAGPAEADALIERDGRSWIPMKPA
jgi:glucose-6-phosphate 1-dehydrogenase